MMVSTRGRYALRVLIDLAMNEKEEHLPLRIISERQGISLKYLESIVQILCKAGYVHGQRGKGGGYSLAVDPSQITVSEVLSLTEGTLAPVACLEAGAACCEHRETCETVQMWRGLNDVVEEYLSNITIADLKRDSSIKLTPEQISQLS